MDLECRRLRQELVSGRSETTGVWPLNSSIAKRPVARTEASFREIGPEDDGLFGRTAKLPSPLTYVLRGPAKT